MSAERQSAAQAIWPSTVETEPVRVPFFVTVNVSREAKVAVTVFAASIATVQVVAVTGVQFTDQPRKTEPDAGVAVSVTLVPTANDLEHVLPQEIPVGFEVTVPVPLPTELFVIVSA